MSDPDPLPREQTGLFPVDAPTFSPRFFEDHVGYLLNDPYLAYIELVANAYDAGASLVEITTPDDFGAQFSVKDNGTGMTADQFARRWKTLSYNRMDEQGDEVEFPPGRRPPRRRAFGRSGKGRHSGFCFADEYRVETHRNGEHTLATVTLLREPRLPFRMVVEKMQSGPPHGTRVFGTVRRNIVVASALGRQLRSKFLVDPSFRIALNGDELSLDEAHEVRRDEIEIEGGAIATVRVIDGSKSDQDGRLRGVAWWVRKRMVGEPSWIGFEGDIYLDGRSSEAKRYTIVVEADFLHGDVKDDWSGFHANRLVNKTREAIDAHVLRIVGDLLAKQRKERKRDALSQHASILGDMPPVSRASVGQFIDELQQRCPGLTDRELSKTVEVYAKLEQSKNGYDLLTQLANCSADDLDTWNDLMKQWTATNAQIVLGELHRRLKLIEQLQRLLQAVKADELHDIHPLFERGLWIIGPQYDAVDFRSNRGMSHVVKEFFGKTGGATSTRRPDIVAVGNGTVGVYAAPAFEGLREVSGFREVLIVELKATGVELSQKELDQARDYCRELRDTGSVSKHTPIRAIVLGSTIEAGLEDPIRIGETEVRPMPYNVMLERAHSRTFNLQRRIEEAAQALSKDPIVEDVVREAEGPDLIRGAGS